MKNDMSIEALAFANIVHNLSTDTTFIHYVQCTSPCCALASTQVVRAIMLFNRKGQNSHQHSSKTVWEIKMSFGTFDYVVEMTTWKKFGVAPPKGGGPTIGWNIRFLWCFFLFFFFFYSFLPAGYRSAHTLRPCKFWLKTRVLVQGSAFEGSKRYWTIFGVSGSEKPQNFPPR